MPRRFAAETWSYLALAVLTAAIWLVALVVRAGPTRVLAHPVILATTAVVVAFVLFDVGSLGWPRLAWWLAAAVLLGPGCGLSRFLFLRAGGGAVGGAWRRRKSWL